MTAAGGGLKEGEEEWRYPPEDGQTLDECEVAKGVDAASVAEFALGWESFE